MVGAAGCWQRPNKRRTSNVSPSTITSPPRPALPCCTNVATWADCGQRAFQKLHPSWLAAGLLLNAGSALTNGGQVMFRPQPLHHLPSLGISARRCTQPTGFAAPTVATLVDCGPIANTLLLVGIWRTLGNHLAIAWQSRGNTMAIGPFFWQSPFSATVGILKRVRL